MSTIFVSVHPRDESCHGWNCHYQDSCPLVRWCNSRIFFLPPRCLAPLHNFFMQSIDEDQEMGLDLVTYLSKDVDIIFVLGCHSGTDLSFFSFIETVLKSIWMLFEEKTKLAESSHDGASWLSRHPILLFQTKTETQMSDGPLDRYSCKSLSRDRGIRSRFGTQTMKHITYFFLCV